MITKAETLIKSIETKLKILKSLSSSLNSRASTSSKSLRNSMKNRSFRPQNRWNISCLRKNSFRVSNFANRNIKLSWIYFMWDGRAWIWSTSNFWNSSNPCMTSCTKTQDFKKNYFASKVTTIYPKNNTSTSYLAHFYVLIVTYWDSIIWRSEKWPILYRWLKEVSNWAKRSMIWAFTCFLTWIST